MSHKDEIDNPTLHTDQKFISVSSEEEGDLSAFFGSGIWSGSLSEMRRDSKSFLFLDTLISEE